MQQNSAQTAGNGGNVPTWRGRMGELPRGHQGARKRQWEAVCHVQRSRVCVRSPNSGPVTHRTVSWGHWGQCQESRFPSEPRPQNQTLKQDKTVGLQTAQGIKAYFWTTKREGKAVRSVILKMRRNNSLSHLVSVSSRGRCSLDRKELEPRARKHASEKLRPEPAAMHVTPWKQTHARTGLWPGPVGGPGKQETGEERRAAGASECVCVSVCA